MPVEQEPGPAGTPAEVLDAFESVPAIIWAFRGPELRVVAANAGARASAGFRPGIVGRPIREVLPELEGQQIFEMMEEAFAGGRVVSADHRRVLVDRDGDGRLEEGFFTYTFLPTRDPDGQVRGLVVHIVETTGQALRQAAAEEAAAVSERRYRHASEVVLELQRSLLPDGVPVLPAVTAAAYYRVAGDALAAGGDWFDVLPLPDGRVALVVGDVVGHGPSAAGAMGQLRAVVVDALRGGEDPAQALARLDRFAAVGRTTRSATVCMAVLDPATGALGIATHAHPSPVVVDAAGGTRLLDLPPGAPLGVGGPAPGWTEHHLRVGDMVLMFSDGLVERPGRALPELLESLAATVSAARGDVADGALDETSLPSSTVERVATLVTERMAFLAEGYRDDVTLLVAERRAAPRSVAVRHDAVAATHGAVRRELTAWLEGAGAGDDDVEATVYAVGEAVANAVQHAYVDRPAPAGGGDGAADRPVRVAAELGVDGVARVVVSDAGTWRPPPSGPVRGGRGVMMMRELVDDTAIEHGPAGTTVRLSRRLSRPVAIGATGPVPPRRPRADALSVDLDEDSGAAVVEGPVDLTTVDQLRAVLLQASRGGARPLRVDLDGVSVLSSVGVQLFHDLVTLAPAMTLAARPDSVAAQVVRLSGLGERLVSPGVPAGSTSSA